MKSIVPIAVCLVALLATPCSALISVGNLDKKQAAEEGITMQSRKNGDAGVMVWIEFKKEGFLEAFNYAELRMRNPQGKHLLSAMLQPRSVVRGQAKDLVTIGFSADPAQLKNFEIMVVAYGSTRGDLGYVLKVKDFIDLEKIAGKHKP